MQIFDRIYSNVQLCKVEIALQGNLTPTYLQNWQPFYNSIPDGDYHKIAASISSINFEQSSEDTSAGRLFKQKVIFRFPNSDSKRSERVVILCQTKFVKLVLNDGQEIVVGRNDYFQNTLPKIDTKENQQTCEVTIEAASMMPIGFVPSNNSFGLPALIPLTLI